MTGGGPPSEPHSDGPLQLVEYAKGRTAALTQPGEPAVEGQDEEEQALRNLERRIRHDPQFTEAEQALIKEVLQVYRGLKGLGTVAKIITIAAAATAAGFAAWDEFLKRFF